MAIEEGCVWCYSKKKLLMILMTRAMNLHLFDSFVQNSIHVESRDCLQNIKQILDSESTMSIQSLERSQVLFALQIYNSSKCLRLQIS